MACKGKLLLSLLLLIFPLAKGFPYLVQRTDQQVPSGSCISSANQTLGPIYALDSIKVANKVTLGWLSKWNYSSGFNYKTTLSWQWIWDLRWHDLPMVVADNSTYSYLADIDPYQMYKNIMMSILAESAIIKINFASLNHGDWLESIYLHIDSFDAQKNQKMLKVYSYACANGHCTKFNSYSKNIAFLENGKRWVHLQILLDAHPMPNMPVYLVLSNHGNVIPKTTDNEITFSKTFSNKFPKMRDLYVKSGSRKPGIFKLHSEHTIQQRYGARGKGYLTRVIERPFGGNICFEITWSDRCADVYFEIKETKSGKMMPYWRNDSRTPVTLTKVSSSVPPGDYEFRIHIPDMSVNFGIKLIKECENDVHIAPATLGRLIGCQPIPLANETINLTNTSCYSIDDGQKYSKICAPLQAKLPVDCSLLKFCSVHKSQINQVAYDYAKKTPSTAKVQKTSSRKATSKTTQVTTQFAKTSISPEITTTKESEITTTALEVSTTANTTMTCKCWYYDYLPYLPMLKGAVWTTFTIAALLSIFLVFECRAYRQMLKEETGDDEEQECVVTSTEIAGASESRL